MEKKDKDSWWELFQNSLVTTFKNSSPIFKITDTVDTLNRNISDRVKTQILEKDSKLLDEDYNLVAPKKVASYIQDKAGKTLIKSGEFIEQAQRTIAGGAADVTQESLQLANLIADKTNLYEFDDELHDKQQRLLDSALKGLLGEESLETVTRGGKRITKVKEPTYFGGSLVRDIGSIIGSVVAGTKGVGALSTAATTTRAGAQVNAAIASSSIATKAAKTSKFITGASIGEQVSINPYEDRLANFLGTMIGDDEGALNDVLEYLKADESKSELDARMGLFYEGLAFTAGLPAAWFGGKAIKETIKNKEAFMGALKELSTGMQKGSIDAEMFTNILRTATKDGRKAPHLVEEKSKDIENLWQFGKGKTKRVLSYMGLGDKKAGEIVRKISTLGSKRLGVGFQEFFKSRGFHTPQVFKVFGKSEAAKNAWIDRTEIVAERIDRNITNLVEKTVKYKNRAKLESTINAVLKNEEFKDLEFLSPDDVARLKKNIDNNIYANNNTMSKTLADEFRQADINKLEKFKKFNSLVPKDLREDIYSMRKLIDEFSELTLQLPTNQISKKLKETISNNLGQWLHTSYEVFESPLLAKNRYEAYKKYSGQVLGDTTKKLSNKEIELYKDTFDVATKYFYNQFRALKSNAGKEDAFVMVDASNKIREILEGASKKGADNYFGRMNDFYGSNLSMFKRKGDLDEPLRDLLGEIKSPSVNILKSVSHLATYIEDNRFLTEAYGLLKGRVSRKAPGVKNKKTHELIPATLKQQKEFIDTQGVRRTGHVFAANTGGVVDSVTGISYTTQLKGKQYGPLNGKYMTEEMAMMFGQRQGFVKQLQDMSGGGFYKSFLALKGYGQASKTVFNHITHLRNTLGGVFFSLANGNNPFHSSSQKAIKTIYQRRFAKVGEEESLAYYNKLISYDLLNTGARYGDIKELLKDGANSTVDDFVQRQLKVFGSQAEVIKKYGKNVQDLYVAEDDLFKIISYEQELNSLLKAAKAQNYKLPNTRGSFSYDEYLKKFPQYAQDLERQAADIVRQTVPTYSLVPNAIKQLRKLPFGNYFSFPAEMVRTSHNIIQQGAKELFLSGNNVTRARGARRLGGFFAAGLAGSEGLSNMTKLWHGVTDEEEQNLKDINPYDYSRNSKFIYYRDKTGKLYKNDFSFIDPYDTIKRPFQTAINEIAHGKRTEEDISRVLTAAGIEAIGEFTKPFFSEALVTQGITTIYKDGVNADGYKIRGWETADAGEKLILSLNEILWKPLAPGFLREIPKTTKSIMGDNYEEFGDGTMAKWLERITTGNVGKKEYSLKGQMIANFTGFRFEEVNIERSLEQKAKQYLRDYDDARRQLDTGLGSKQTGDDFLKGLARANKKVYYAQKNFQAAYEAAGELGLDSLTRSQILDKANVPASIKNSMNYNSFQALLPSGTKYERFLEQNLQGPMGVQTLKYYVGEYNKVYKALPMLDIGFESQADDGEDIPTLRQVTEQNIEFVRNPKSVSKIKAKIEERLNRTKGGLITGPDVVSYTKENPAERVNPYTGEAYQEDINFFDEIAKQFEDKK
tara:strand:+ start:993 stop:5621 length:4629 start_codon:yes stop_codon:yes gene_type:complete